MNSLHNIILGTLLAASPSELDTLRSEVENLRTEVAHQREAMTIQHSAWNQERAPTRG